MIVSTKQNLNSDIRWLTGITSKKVYRRCDSADKTNRMGKYEKRNKIYKQIALALLVKVIVIYDEI